ncbi:MAG: hypothetical protein JOY70_07310 [Acidisphaera sp.]|nr:hypothetical protein [Acidisphaera sp.]
MSEQVAALSSLNMRLRDDFVGDCEGGIGRWNKVIEKAGFAFRLALPHVGFNRRIGEFASVHVSASGRVVPDMATVSPELPSSDDNEYITSLMQPTREVGRFAGWIAPPKAGIDNKPGNFEYVKIQD